MSVSDRFREEVDIYAAQSAVLPDLNRVPDRFAHVASHIPCNLHRGTKAAQEHAQTLGIIALGVGFAFFGVQDYPKLADRSVLIDADKQAWLIKDAPLKRSRFAETAHVRVFVQQIKTRPAGLPPL